MATSYDYPHSSQGRQLQINIYHPDARRVQHFVAAINYIGKEFSDEETYIKNIMGGYRITNKDGDLIAEIILE